MGDMPLMTDNGTFIVNGTERVIVSRCTARRACSSTTTRARPTLGQAPVRRPHHPLSRLLARLRVRRQGHRLRPHRPQAQAAGHVAAARARPDGEEILNTFYNRVTYVRGPRTAGRCRSTPSAWRGFKPYDLVDAETGEVVLRPARSSPPARPPARREGASRTAAPDRGDLGPLHRRGPRQRQTGEIYAEAGDEISRRISRSSTRPARPRIEVLDIDHVNVGPYIRNTLKPTRPRTARTRCSTSTASCARASRRRSRPAEALFYGLFFDASATTSRPWAA
jgi:DNA-directed RNA polymerase subunit beta